MTQWRYLEPLDVLYLRGNRLFEGAGAHAEALMAPWPSLVAGALRSRMLVDAGADLGRFAASEGLDDPELQGVLGTPAQPGSFRVTHFTLARALAAGVEPCLPLPADLVASEGTGGLAVGQLHPAPLPVATSTTLPLAPVLRQAGRGKPAGGYWLDAAGWRAYVAGEPVSAGHLVPKSSLWEEDPRLGIALDGTRGTTGEGMLYTAEAVALRSGVGFLVGVGGAPGRLPASGLLRLGGDGRGSAVRPAAVPWPDPDWAAIDRDRRLRLVLTTPGLFPQGWRLPGVAADGTWHGPDGLTGRLACAAVPRAAVVSGWDLAARRPKAAQRVVPAGAVYWLDRLQGDAAALGKLAGEGLWALMREDEQDAQRRAEGFNGVQIAAWPTD